VDEVQTGFGRAGTHFWMFETQHVIPDIMTMGKPIGNGHPLGAVVTTRKIASAFENGMEYFNTFGGNPVSCAIGLSVLDVIQEEGLQANAHDVGAYLKAGLTQIQQKHELIGDVRGIGLYIGVELVRDRKTKTPATQHAAYVVERMRDRGILLSTDGPFHNVIKIKPPMVFTRSNADQVVENLDLVLNESLLRL
jgi:4-aminobutyrate aminotransferase-like enzyme